MMDRRACWMVTLLTGLVCLSVWQIIGCPGPPNPAYMLPAQLQPPSYSLITAANATTVEPAYDLDRLPPDDYTRLMNFSDFRFTMMTHACSDNEQPPLLLVLVHSAPRNTDKRKTIRETWGASRDSIRLVFLLGAVYQPDLIQHLRVEQKQYGDLVQGNFDDAYRNMTYKHVMALKFATYHCPRARYVLKTDDDVFVNMPTMMAFLNVEFSAWGARRLLFCDVMRVSDAKRSYRSKWRVSFREYRPRIYPTYCSGYAILYSPDVVFTLYREAQHSDYFWIDDVLVTGILVARTGLEHTHLPSGLLLKRDTMLKMVVEDSGTDFSFLYGPVNMTPDHIRSLWKIVDNYHHATTTLTKSDEIVSEELST